MPITSPCVMECNSKLFPLPPPRLCAKHQFRFFLPRTTRKARTEKNVRVFRAVRGRKSPGIIPLCVKIESPCVNATGISVKPCRRDMKKRGKRRRIVVLSTRISVLVTKTRARGMFTDALGFRQDHRRVIESRRSVRQDAVRSTKSMAGSTKSTAGSTKSRRANHRKVESCP